MKYKKRQYKREPGRIVSRLDAYQYDRVLHIRDKYGFKSVYEMSQYLWACFLRVADPDNDKEEEPIPDEIASMFSDLSNAERRFDYVKPKKALPKHVIDEFNGQLRMEFK